MKPYYMKSLDEYQGNRQYDAFFCANGLEGRDTRVVKLFQKKMFKVKKWVVFDYAERVAERMKKKKIFLFIYEMRMYSSFLLLTVICAAIVKYCKRS